MLRPLFQTSSLGEDCQEFSLSGFIRFSIDLSLERLKSDRLFASREEELLKQDKKAYYIYSAVDMERNELILMRVYTNRNYLVTRSFREMLKFFWKNPGFIVDKLPSLIDALKSLDLEFERSVLSEHEIHPKDFMQH